MAEPKKYNCKVCNHTNFIVPKLEEIDVNRVYVTTCYYCETKFKVGNEALYIIPDSTSDKYTERLKSNDKSNNDISNEKEKIIAPSPKEDKLPIITYVILGLFIVCGVCFVMDYLSRGNDSLVANKVSQIIPSNTTDVPADAVSYEPNNSVELKDESVSNIQPDQNSSTYYGKYTLGEDKIWYSDNFSMTVSKGQITYIKAGNTKYFDVIDEGVYTRKEREGITFTYQKYYLTSKRVYMLISHKKEVEHNGISYYRIIIDGQTQLAL